MAAYPTIIDWEWAQAPCSTPNANASKHRRWEEQTCRLDGKITSRP